MVSNIILALLFVFLMVFIYFEHRVHLNTITHLIKVICNLEAFVLGVPTEDLKTLTEQPTRKQTRPSPPSETRDFDEDFGEIKPPKDESEV
jgi:hypothetical protein